MYIKNINTSDAVLPQVVAHAMPVDATAVIVTEQTVKIAMPFGMDPVAARHALESATATMREALTALHGTDNCHVEALYRDTGYQHTTELKITHVLPVLSVADDIDD